ncbi:hypothetical protein BVRB_9g211900 [Beta vulgaris subsp. vulgaris]|nr:hypothetical protein BVRB_9g211900 [Beta vulgaris subsp. vulgaris]
MILFLSPVKKNPNPNTLTLLSRSPRHLLSSSRRRTLADAAPMPNSHLSFALLPCATAPSPFARQSFLPLFPSLSSPIHLRCCYWLLLPPNSRCDAAARLPSLVGVPLPLVVALLLQPW